MWQQLLEGARQTSSLELVSLATGVAYALLAVRRLRWCWLFGAVSSIGLIYLAWQARLPMQAALQVFYVLMAGYGFVSWSRRSGSAPVAVARGTVRGNVVLLLAVIGLGVTLAPWVAAYTEAAWPRIDTAVTVASIVATWLTARARLESWAYWIVIDLISIGLYVAQGLLFVALLYLIYAGIAVAGWIAWRRQ